MGREYEKEESMICPHCKENIELDMELIMQALKAEPGFMKRLGEEAAKTYFGISEEKKDL